jgi:hypothetical protein
MEPMRTFVLKGQDGQPVNELTVMFKDRLRTFPFPYQTSDKEEINFLLKRGAKEKYIPPTRQPSPTVRKSVVPLKGGE